MCPCSVLQLFCELRPGLMAKLRGDDAAQLTHLAMEYDPQPPFHSGSPKTADPRTIHQTMTAMASEMEKLARKTRLILSCLVQDAGHRPLAPIQRVGTLVSS